MILQYKIADKSDIEDLLAARCETLRAVCNLESDFKFSEKFLNDARNYFEQGHHTTVLALDQDKIIGCASICYITVMPTFDHPTGKRAHIMNVAQRRQFEPVSKTAILRMRALVSIFVATATTHSTAFAFTK